MTLDFPKVLLLKKTARHKLVAGMHANDFAHRRPIDPTSLPTVNINDCTYTFSQIPLDDWQAARKRLVRDMSRRKGDHVVLLGCIDVQVLLAAIDANPLGRRGMQQTFDKIRALAKETGVCTPDP